MSVSTTGFVLTETKNVFFVLSTIESILIELIKKYAIKDIPIFRDTTSKFPRIECYRFTLIVIVVIVKLYGELTIGE